MVYYIIKYDTWFGSKYRRWTKRALSTRVCFFRGSFSPDVCEYLQILTLLYDVTVFTFAELWHITGKYTHNPTGLSVHQPLLSYIPTINQLGGEKKKKKERKCSKEAEGNY